MRKFLYGAFVLSMGIAIMACNRKAANELSAETLKTYDDLVASSQRMITESQNMMQEHETLIAQAEDSLERVESTYDSVTLSRIIERLQGVTELYQEMMQDYKTLEQYYKDVKTQHTSGAMPMDRIQQERAELERDHQRIMWDFERIQRQHEQAEKEIIGYLGAEKSFWRRPPAPDTMMMDSMGLMPGMDSMRMDSMRRNMQNPPRDTSNRNKRQ